MYSSCNARCNISGSPTSAEHAHWRVLSVGARHARAVENYKGWTRTWHTELRASGARERERERDERCFCHSALTLWGLTVSPCHCFELCSLLSSMVGPIIMAHLCLPGFRDGLGWWLSLINTSAIARLSGPLTILKNSLSSLLLDSGNPIQLCDYTDLFEINQSPKRHIWAIPF